MKLPIPDQSGNQLWHSIYKLYQLSIVASKSDDLLLQLDFSKVNFLNVPFLTGLFCLTKQWKNAGRQIEILGYNNNIASYCNTIHFPNGFCLDTNPDLITNLKNYEKRSYLPLTVFPCFGYWEDILAYEQCINSLLLVIKNQLKPSPNYQDAISQLIVELGNNIREHSGSDYGIMSAQFYPKLSCIDIVIADNGKGIFASYENNENFNPNSEPEAFQFALDGKSTKDDAVSRGFGLTGSRRLTVEGTNGTFLMWSGQTLFGESIKNKSIFEHNDGSFKGCFITLRLPIIEKTMVSIIDAYS